MSNTIYGGLGTLLSAVHTTSPSQGLTHSFYKYPARFSSEFARAAIKHFSNPGDVVLDPFMGSGTTLVESLVLRRHAIGTDINSLAHFVAQTKLSILPQEDIDQVHRWAIRIKPRLNLHRPVTRNQEFIGTAYQKDVPWPIRKTIELVLNEVEKLPKLEQQNLIKCALLKTGQWALDCTTIFPSAAQFRAEFLRNLQELFNGINELRKATQNVSRENRPTVLCFNVPVIALDPAHWRERIPTKPSLVVTSPPYPKVHILYHRWQIRGRKETAAPFWIVGQNDGEGASFYTMGSRSPTGVNNYFLSIEESFEHIHSLLAKEARVVQLVAFSDIEEHLPRYLEAMRAAGYAEIEINVSNTAINERVWRRVPLRRWYATLKGDISASREFLLVHKRIN